MRQIVGNVITRASCIVRESLLGVRQRKDVKEGFGQFMPKLIIFIKIKADQIF